MIFGEIVCCAIEGTRLSVLMNFSSSVTTAQCGSIFGFRRQQEGDFANFLSKLEFAIFGNNLFRVLCHAVEVFRLKER